MTPYRYAARRVAGCAGVLSVTAAFDGCRCLPRVFRADNPHGMATGVLRLRALRVVVVDDGWSLGGHRAIVGRSPDRKRPPLTQGRGMLP